MTLKPWAVGRTMLLPRRTVACVVAGAGLLVACAGTPKPVAKPGAPSAACAARGGGASARTAADAVDTQVAAAALLELVPPGALAAAVLRQSLVTTLLSGVQAPELRDELSKLFRERLGADLIKVTDVVLYVTGPAKTPQAALLARLPAAAVPAARTAAAASRGEVVERRRGVALRAVGEGWVSARVPAGLLLGHRAAVRAGVDHLVGPGVPAAAAGTLTPRLRALDRPGVQVLAAVRSAGAQDFAAQAAALGVDALALAYGPGRELVLRLSGDPARLDAVLGMFVLGLKLGVAGLEQQYLRKRQSESLLDAVTAVVGYRQLRDVLQAVAPQKVGDAIVVRASLPDWALSGSPLLLGVAGVAAATVLPRFVRNQRGAAADDGTVSLRRLRDALVAYHAGSERRGNAFRWPATTPWSPAKGCCLVPGQRQPCGLSLADFSHPSWRALGFAPTEPTPYRFRLTSGGRGLRAWVEIEARADRECDGTLTSHRQRGWFNRDGTLTFGPNSAPGEAR